MLKTSVKGMLILSFLLVFTINGISDLKMVMESHTGAFMGQPEETKTFTTYVTDNALRMDLAESFYLLYHAQDSKFYLVYPEKKEYSVVNLEELKPTLAMMEQMLGEVTVTSSDDKPSGKIENWDCFQKSINVSSNMLQIESVIDFTRDVKYQGALEKFYRDMTAFQAGMGKYTNAIIDTNAFPVKFESTMKMMGQEMKSSVNTKEISEEDLPDEMFVLNPEFKQVPLVMEDYQKAFQ